MLDVFFRFDIGYLNFPFKWEAEIWSEDWLKTVFLRTIRDNWFA